LIENVEDQLTFGTENLVENCNSNMRPSFKSITCGQPNEPNKEPEGQFLRPGEGVLHYVSHENLDGDKSNDHSQ